MTDENKNHRFKNKMFIQVIETCLEEFNELNNNSKLPKKFSMDLIMKKIRDISAPLKEEKREKKGKGNVTEYNLFVKEKMPIVRKENPEKKGNEHMKIVSQMWQEHKKKNPPAKKPEDKTPVKKAPTKKEAEKKDDKKTATKKK